MEWLRSRRETRAQLLLRRRAARKRERYVAAYEFPPHIETRVRRRFPELTDDTWMLVERGLREWFVCCAWRGRAVLGMPSRIVDEAWHEFILSSVAYTGFCNAAFDKYIHHTPDEAMSGSMGNALAATVRAWDRSEMGSQGESVLWDLDEQLGIDEPLRISGVQLAAIRTDAPFVGAATGCFVGADSMVGEGGGGGFEGGGGEGGGGCGGGGGGGCGGGGGGS